MCVRLTRTTWSNCRSGVENSLQAGAHSSGCELSCSSADMRAYDSVVSNEPLAALYVANAASCGRLPQQPAADTQVLGSTDMGNVSRQVPAIHPMIKVAPEGGVHPHARVCRPHPQSRRGCGGH